MYTSGKIRYPANDSEIESLIDQYRDKVILSPLQQSLRVVIARYFPDDNRHYIYYAHSPLSYRTEKEKVAIRTIHHYFPNFNIINPKNIDTRHLKFSDAEQLYFELLSRSKYVVFTEYKQSICKRVYEELFQAFKEKKMIYLIFNGKIQPIKRKHLYQFDLSDIDVAYAKIKSFQTAQRETKFRALSITNKKEKVVHVQLKFDGGSYGNPGPAGAGWWIRIGSKQYWGYQYLGIKTNNHAEYVGLILGLKDVIQRTPNKNRYIEIYGDSQLVVRQLYGRYAVWSNRLKPLFYRVRNLLNHFVEHKICWIERSENKKADGLATQAIQLGKPKKSDWWCNLCGKEFGSKQALQDHQRSKHIDQSVTCPHCNKTFATRHALQQHQNDKHQKKKTFDCQYCKKSFKSAQARTQHANAKHPEKLPTRVYVCSVCGKNFSSEHALEQHQAAKHLNNEKSSSIG